MLGQSTTEMALAIPVLVLFMFGIIEMGRLFFAYVTVQYAAGKGARFAVTGAGELEGDRLERIVAEATQAASTLSDSVNVYVRSWNGSTATGGGVDNDPGDPCDLVEVEVRYTYQPVIPLISTFLPEELELRGKDRKLNEPWTPCN
jgi:Flp pilus assembly protein TadG